MSAPSQPSRAAKVRHCLFLLLFCLVLYVPGISGLPATDRDESRYVQATRQMVESGDYVDIRFRDEPRYLKPVGIYWMQSAAVHLYHTPLEAPIWVNRLVSVTSAAAAVIGLYLLAAALFGTQAGLLSALGFAGIFMLGFEARIAKTDAALLAATLLAQAGMALVYVAARRGETARAAHAWMFWAGLGLGTLIKGPLTPAVVGLTIAGLAIIDRFDMRWLRQLRPLSGILVFLAMVVPWFIAITATAGWEFWEIAINRSFLSKVTSAQESHGAPPGYYLLLMAVFMWPANVHVLKAGLIAFAKVRSDARIGFAVAWFVPFWIAVELAPTKLPHYILPAYPAAFILMGALLAGDVAMRADLRRWQEWFVRFAWFGLGLVTLLLAGAFIGATVYFEGRVSAAGIVAAAFFLLAGWLASGFRPGIPILHRIGGASLAAGLAMGISSGWVLPSVERLWVSETIAAEWRNVRICDDKPLVSSGYAEPSLVYLTSRDIVFAEPNVAAALLLEDPGCTVVAISAEGRDMFFAALPAGEDSVTAIGAADGFYYTKGRDLQMTFFASVDAAPPQ